MTAPNSLASERIAITGIGIPQTIALGGTANTDYALIRNFARFLAIISIGNIAGATLTAKIQVASTTADADLADINGTSVVLTDLQNFKVVLINVDSDQLAGTIYKYIRVWVSVGGASAMVAFSLLGIDPRYGPADDFNHANVYSITSENTGYTIVPPAEPG